MGNCKCAAVRRADDAALDGRDEFEAVPVVELEVFEAVRNEKSANSFAICACRVATVKNDVHMVICCVSRGSEIVLAGKQIGTSEPDSGRMGNNVNVG